MKTNSRNQALYITGYQFGYPIAGDELPAKNVSRGTIQIHRSTLNRFRDKMLLRRFAEPAK